MNDIRCGYNEVVNPKITLVQGNTLELTVSLKQRVRTFNGTEWVTTETAYTPSEDEVVTVELRDKKRRRAASYVAEVNGSNATIREEGTLPIGIYEVSVIGRGGTNPWRYAEDVFVEVIKWTADAPDEDEIATGQVVAYDMDVVTYDIFRGNGIESIRKTSTVGNVDTYTITFTYGEPTTFTVTNAPIDVYNDTLGAFDISSHHATGDVLAKYADLSAALDGGNNIPESVRKGGMSVKFVQSSDNKYVQYRLTTDEFSTNTDDWAIAEEGIYVDNHEFVYVKTDAEGKIIWAIKADGGIYYGAGVPQQVVDYIEKKLSDLPLDEHENIVAFLNDLEKGDKTLQDLLNEKVDKEEGKSLIDEEYASTKSTTDNPEFLEVTTDNEDKILEGIQKDGTKIIGGDLKVLSDMEVSGVSYKVTENPEFVRVVTDADGKILYGVKADGEFVFGTGCPEQIKDYINEKISSLSFDKYENIVAFLTDYLEGDTTLKAMIDEINAQIANKVDKVEGKSLIDEEYASSQSAIDNPEYLQVTTDSEDKILEGIKQDGTKVIGADLEVGGNTTIGGDTKILGDMEVSGVSYKVVENPEYLAAWVDAEDKVIFGLKADGKTYVGDADFLDDIESIKEFLANFNDKNIDWDALTSITATENPEYIEVKIDSEDKIVEATKVDGTKAIPAGIETPKVNLEGATIENKANPEYIEAKVDAEDKLLEGTKTDGTKVIGGNLEVGGGMRIGGEVNFTNGIPQEIVDYVAANTGSGVSEIEYDDTTGDMYATYEDADGVTDVYMEENGDIYAEIEE